MMRKRLVLLYLALVLVVAGTLSVAAYRSSARLYRQEVENRLLDNAALLGELLLPGDVQAEETGTWQPGTHDGLARQYAARLDVDHTGRFAQGRLRITLIREDGVVVGDSEADSTRLENHADRPELIAAKRAGKGSDERVSASTGIPYLYHARWFPEAAVFVRLALPLQALRDILTRVLWTALAGILVSLLLTGVLARVFSRVVTAPVVRISRQLSDMDPQQAGFRLPMQGDRDLGPLARNVNGLAERLETSVRALGERNAEVDTIISSLQTGLVAVDRQLRLVMVNPVAFGMLGARQTHDALGRPLVEVFRQESLLDMLEAGVRDNRSEQREVVLLDEGRRVLAISVCPILPRGEDGPAADGNLGALAHVADVTAVRRLEEMRSQFVANVTHELKTPLTSIRGFVETLRAGAISDERTASRFLEIIEIEVERLSGLIDDILALSEIEGLRNESGRETFALPALVGEVFGLVAAAAGERQVTLEVDMPEAMALVANRNRIKQLLLNLVDNAIKYNREQGRVTVAAVPLGAGGVEISVSDTGIGIPQAYQERIFERFYRVDPGRTRSAGGTGLGLSIVKHIAQLYGGTVSVQSEPDRGSRFVVNLPDVLPKAAGEAGRSSHGPVV
jgi:two-component system phosphate regulon sensor histidine kinase PhoR